MKILSYLAVLSVALLVQGCSEPTLTGPASSEQLRENLDGMAKGPMTDEELGWMRDFGKVVHG